MEHKKMSMRILEVSLKYMAKAVLLRHHPKVIGITGSVGKTTTKDMIVHIVRQHKTVCFANRNFNNEIGVPLTIIGAKKDIGSWGDMMCVIGAWIRVLSRSTYPEILIVEMGVDRPGDMEYLLSIVKPDIAVLTAVSFAHSQFFASIEEIAKEKQKIITQTERSGVAIVNYDDRYTRSVQEKVRDPILFYGTQDGAMYRATDIEVCFRQCHATGLSFKLNYEGKVIPVRLHHLCAQHLVYAALAALAVAHQLHINMIEAVRDLADFVTSPGRMRLLEGKNDVLIIDDTYNASPKAMEAAIKTLHVVPASRRIAVLGDMRELGVVSKEAHEEIAREILRSDIDAVFLVGQEMQHAYIELAKVRKNVWHKMSSKEIVSDVRVYLEQGDVILVKGSRGIHMEIVTRDLAIDPSQTL